jgi:hypothetical protein
MINQDKWPEKTIARSTPFWNRDILKRPIKTPGQMPFHVQKEINCYTEMKNKILDIDVNVNVNVWDNTRSVIEPISFHLFHGTRDSAIHI